MTSKIYTTLVIEDDPMINEKLCKRLNESDRWQVLGSVQTVTEAVEQIGKHKPDAVFLDIKLHEGNAFRILNMLSNLNVDIPPVILNTGFTEFEYAQRALNEFSQEIIMLIKKPYWEKWVEIEECILEKLDELYTSNDDLTVSEDTLALRVGNKTHFIRIEDVQFIEVESTHSAKCKLCTINQVIIINKTLSKVKQILPTQFVQISRQTLVNKKKIKEYSHEDHTLVLQGIENRRFDVGMAFKKNIL